MRRAPLGLLTLALVVLAAACGGGNDLTKAQFVKQADAICQKYDAKISAVPRPQSLNDVGQYMDRVIPLFKDEVDAIDGLKPPKEIEGRVDGMVASARKTVTAAEDLRDAAKKKDEAAVRKALHDGQAASASSDKAARDLGLKRCGSSET